MFYFVGGARESSDVVLPLPHLGPDFRWSQCYLSLRVRSFSVFLVRRHCGVVHLLELGLDGLSRLGLGGLEAASPVLRARVLQLLLPLLAPHERVQEPKEIEEWSLIYL